MKRLLGFCVCLCLASSTFAAYKTHDQIGAQVVFDMWAYYTKVVSDCGTPKRPAFLCSGLPVRGTVSSDEYLFWNYGPASQQATAFSWLRKDAKFRQLASDHRHGYVIWPMFETPKNYLQLEVLCAAPLDMGSHARDDYGCGDAINTPQVERSCQAQGITTASAWLNDYLVNQKSHYRQCAFDVRPANEPASANIFMQFIKTHGFPEVEYEHYDVRGFSNNEIRIQSWPQSKGQRVPILAIFYISKDPVSGAPSEVGKDAAQKDQMALYKHSGHYVPIIRMTLPRTNAEDASFFYAPADQAPLATVRCERFIDDAAWVKRFDPGAKADKWTLQITPTDCGRLSQADQLDNFYAEVVAKYGTSPEWLAEFNGGVRGQLACLLSTFRANTTYNIEPFRPSVAHSVAVAQGCNPI